MPEAGGDASATAPPADRPDHLEARHRRFLATETAIGTVMSGLVPAVVIWLFQTPSPLPVFGSHSLASSLILATVLPGFSVPIGLTLAVRRRVRKGSAPGLAWPLRVPGLVRWVPGPLVLRGVVAAAVALLVVPPAGLLLMMAAGVRTISGGGFILYNFAHGMGIGGLVLRPVLIRALADGGSVRGATALAM